MGISDYLHLLRTYGLLFVLMALIGCSGGLVVSLVQTPQYQASVKVFVAAQQATNLADLSQGNDLAESLVRSYSEVVITPVVLAPVIRSAALRTTTVALAKQIKTTSPLNTTVLEIDVVDRSPAQAAKIANAVAKSLIATVPTLTPPTADSAQPVKMTVLQGATAPVSPVVPNRLLNVVLGVVVALAIALLVLLIRGALREAMRQRHLDVEDELREQSTLAAPDAEPALRRRTNAPDATRLHKRVE